ncbi:MAG: M28 family peptidase, partial [Gemmatimonadetes bacterium]|nr:M28 family peptidase [Gemmatimonadota bacterium]
SFHYVSQAQAQGLDILGMINFDMIGYTCGSPGCQQPFWDIGGCFQVDPDGVNVGRYAATLVNDASAELLASCSFAAGSYVPELEVVTMQVVGNGDCFGFTRRSDHVPFWEAGIPALEFLNTYGSRNPYYHTPNDLLATLDMEFCLRVTRTALALAMLTEQAGMPEVPTTLAFSTLDGALPNPCSGEARIRFALPRAGTLALRIHDVTGRRLRTLAAGLWGEGTHELSWDGRDDTGRRLGGGAYFISLETAGQRLTRRLVLAE